MIRFPSDFLDCGLYKLLGDDMAKHSPFYVRIHPVAELDRLRKDPAVFALIRQSTETQVQNGSPMEILISTPILAEDVVEAWYSREAFEAGGFERVVYRASDTFVFGSLFLEEDGFADVAETTQAAYEQIFRVLDKKGYPGLLRMWNFLQNINEIDDGLERYRSFCLGRHRAVESWKFLPEQLPAATAIGHVQPGLLVYFVAARQTGIQIENPRQVSAFRYPTLYGPRSPSFSRAILKNWGKSQQLFISGTASIVGHETRHRGDPIAQLRETLENMRAVIDQAQQSHGVEIADIAELSALRIYIRDPDTAPAILDVLSRETGRRCPVSSVVGDVCRRDLLLEIEGMFAP